MAETESSEKSRTGAESPTTARELDWDDDEGHENSATPAHEGTPSQPKTTTAVPPTQAAAPTQEEAPPAKPPRPMSPQAQAEATLIEAFPDMDAKVVKAVLVASGGKVEPAFNALLGMSDPSFKAEEEAPPPQPPRRTQPRTQLEADELYARQLNEHYNAARYSQRQGEDRGPPLPRRRQQNYEEDDGETSPSFFDEELPKIQENIRKGFQDTQRTVNRWISDFKRRMDGSDDEDIPAKTGTPERPNYGSSSSQPPYGTRRDSQRARPSGDRERYDSDPHVLDDDFTQLELRDDEETTPELPTRRSTRPLANPDLFKPTPTHPPSAPQSGPVDEVDAALYRQPSPAAGGQSGSNSNSNNKPGSKWQPLTSVAPQPEPEDSDPFSVGDDEEEVVVEKGRDLRPEDSERLKKAAVTESAGAAGQEGEGGSKGELRPAERSGSTVQKDAEAEKLLSPSTK